MTSHRHRHPLASVCENELTDHSSTHLETIARLSVAHDRMRGPVAPMRYFPFGYHATSLKGYELEGLACLKLETYSFRAVRRECMRFRPPVPVDDTDLYLISL